MSAVTDRFAAMSPGAVSDHFATAAASEIATLVQDSEDGDLRRVLEIDHVRAALLDAILSRFAEFADADRLAVLEGVVRFELVASKKRTEVHTLSFHDGGVARDSRESPQVTITADTVDFVRLATGHANAALLYLGGRLGIEGHDLLALDVGNVFSLPGSDRAAIDPTSLDPVDVATAVATTSSKHMRRVMEGGFRAILLAEVFRRFPDFIDEGSAAELDLCVGFRIGGRKDGEVDRYAVHVQRGSCTVETDPAQGQRRDATITLDGADFLRLVTGQLHPVRGVLTGTMKVKGDRAKALALNSAMTPPQPRR